MPYWSFVTLRLLCCSAFGLLDSVYSALPVSEWVTDYGNPEPCLSRFESRDLICANPRRGIITLLAVRHQFREIWGGKWRWKCNYMEMEVLRGTWVIGGWQGLVIRDNGHVRQKMGGEWRRLCHWWSASQLPGLQFHGLPMLSNAFQLSIKKFNVDERLTTYLHGKISQQLS